MPTPLKSFKIFLRYFRGTMQTGLPQTPLTGFRERARTQALAFGLSRCGFTTADPLSPDVERRWRRWLAEDKAGAMGYLTRPTPRRTHPRDLLPEARTAIVVLAGYHDGCHLAPPSPPAGKIARYAWGRDYHLVLRERLERLAAWIEAEARAIGMLDAGEPFTARPCVDSAPLDERALAVRAGLGFIGKNTLLLTPDAGSYGLIGVLLISLALPPDPPLKPSPTATCGSCRRCIDVCPTAALEGPWRLDPRRCTSYLTIEQRDAIPPPLAARMQGWAFGCDLCQEVCPFNERPLARLLPELAADAGAGPWLTGTMLEAEPGVKAFARRWAHTPLARPGLKGLRRNLDAIDNPREKSDP